MATTERQLWRLAIRDARLRMGFTQAQVAGLIGVSQQTVSGWEASRGKEPHDTIKPILIERLQIDPADVVPEWLRGHVTIRRPAAA